MHDPRHGQASAQAQQALARQNADCHRDKIQRMSALTPAFEAAVAQSRDLTERPSNATLLKIYALYKQATEGDVATDKPGFSDLVGRAKWDAWNTLRGTTPDDAMQQYVDLIASLA